MDTNSKSPAHQLKTYAYLALALMFVLGQPLQALSKSKTGAEISGSELLAAKPDQILTAFVELDKPSVVESATFGLKHPYSSVELMRAGNPQTKLFETSLKYTQHSHLQSVKELCPAAVLGSSYQYAFNGYCIKTKRSDLDKIAVLPGVRRIFSVKPPQLMRTRNRKLVGAEKVWETVKDPDGRPVDGSGVLIGVTDTGLDYTHPDFGSQKTPTGSKVIISRDLAAKDNDCQEEAKSMGMHGTACASIAAGDGPDNPVTGVKEKGMAPKARLAGYKGSVIVEGEEQFTAEAAMESWEWNVRDKIMVSSNSWGVPGGEHEYEKQELACTLVGCTVVAANGNFGQQGDVSQNIPQGTAASGNCAIGVGASEDTDQSFLKLTDVSGVLKKITGMWGYTGKFVFTNFDSKFQVVDCIWGREKDFAGLNVKGKIALIERGPFDETQGPAITFKEKIENAYQAGAVAIIMANCISGPIYADYLNGADENDPNLRMLPVYEIDINQTLLLKRNLHYGNDWKQYTIDKNQKPLSIEFSTPAPKGGIADFSSNGPTKLGFLKPDVCAAGTGIHAAISHYYWKTYNGYYFETMGGTSGATPIVAGCAALVKQARPNWSPFEIKRSLMNTATLLLRTDGNCYYPFVAQGMGRVNVYDAATTKTLVQPPSALIVANTGKINMADVPSELADPVESKKIPENVIKSNIPLKVTNYSDKPITLSISYEVNSGNPSQFGISLTTTEITIPAAAKNPGVGWIGLNVKLPKNVEGALNDIIIWMTDKLDNKKIHTGVCIYGCDPQTGGAGNGIIKDLKTSGYFLSPDGDGVNDTIDFSYDVSNCSWSCDYSIPCWLNQGKMLQFWAKSQANEKWSLIHVEEEFEAGPGKFIWDGKDIFGTNLLPDGEWTFAASVLCRVRNENNEVVDQFKDYDTPLSVEVSNSPAQAPPTLFTHSNPPEPGKGENFVLELHLTRPEKILGIKFKLKLPDNYGMVKYVGVDDSNNNEAITLTNIDFDEKTSTFDISIQRKWLENVGDSWLPKLKFTAVEAGYFNVVFSNVEMTESNDTGKEVKAKGFWRNTEHYVLPKSFHKADFNRDGAVNDVDLGIIEDVLGLSEGEQGFNWRCDLNYDKKVDMEDIAIFSKFFGKN